MSKLILSLFSAISFLAYSSEAFPSNKLLTYLCKSSPMSDCSDYGTISLTMPDSLRRKTLLFFKLRILFVASDIELLASFVSSLMTDETGTTSFTFIGAVYVPIVIW